MLVYWQTELIGKQVLLLVVKLGVDIKDLSQVSLPTVHFVFVAILTILCRKERRLICCQQATKRRFANTLSSISSSVLLLIPETQRNHTVYYTANLSAMTHCDQ